MVSAANEWRIWWVIELRGLGVVERWRRVIGRGKGGIVQKCAEGMVKHDLRVSVRIVEDDHNVKRSCVHAALYKNRLFVAAIYRRRNISVWVKRTLHTRTQTAIVFSLGCQLA